MRIWIYLDNGGLFETLEVINFREKSRTYKLELKNYMQVKMKESKLKPVGQ